MLCKIILKELKEIWNKQFFLLFFLTADFGIVFTNV